MKKILLLLGIFTMIIFFSSFVNASYPPTSGVSYYNFSSTTDLWGSSNGTASASGLTSVTDYPVYNKSGNSSPNSFDFDGVNGEVTISNYSMCRVSTSSVKSFSLWNTHDDSSTAGIIDCGYNPSGGSFAGWKLGYSGSDMEFHYLYGSTVKDITFTPLSPTNFNHYVITFDSGTISLYENNVLKGTTTMVSNNTYENSFVFGSLNSGNYLHGKMDEIRIYNKVLPTSEIYNLYNYGTIESDYDIISNQNNYTVYMQRNSTEYTFNTTNGIILGIGIEGIFNITIDANNSLWNNTYTNYNISEPLISNFPLLNVSAYDIINASDISNFSITVGNSDILDSANTTDGSAQVICGESRTYNVSIDAEGFVTRSDMINLSTDVIKNYNFVLPNMNSINISIYDQENGSIITQNTSMSVIDSDGQTTYTITNGTYYIKELDPNNYTFTFSSEGYSISSYEVVVSDRSFQELEVYMLSDTIINDVLFTMKDRGSGNEIESVSMSILQIIDDEWTLVSTYSSDVSGKIQFNYLEDTNYKFILTRTGYENKNFTLNPILLDSYNIWLDRSTEEQKSGDHQGVSIVWDPYIYSNNENNSFNIVFANPDGDFKNFGYNITWQTSFVEDSSNNAYGKSFNNNIEIINASSEDEIILRFYYTLSDGNTYKYLYTYRISEASDSVGSLFGLEDNTYGMGLFTRIIVMIFIILPVAGVASYFAGIEVGAIMGLLFFGYFTYIGFVSYWITTAPILLLISYIMWRSKLR